MTSGLRPLERCFVDELEEWKMLLGVRSDATAPGQMSFMMRSRDLVLDEVEDCVMWMLPREDVADLNVMVLRMSMSSSSLTVDPPLSSMS
eukprot:4758847-Amphidinium_carterae.1